MPGGQDCSSCRAFLRALKRYDRGSSDVCREITSFSGLPIRLQRLPEQKNLPSAHALTQRESGPFMAIVA